MCISEEYFEEYFVDSNTSVFDVNTYQIIKDPNIESYYIIYMSTRNMQTDNIERGIGLKINDANLLEIEYINCTPEEGAKIAHYTTLYWMQK